MTDHQSRWSVPLGRKCTIEQLLPKPMHEAFMRQALALAEEAQAAGEVPVGAVVVLGAAVVGAARNQTVAHGDPTAHAEMLAIREACGRIGNYPLDGAVVSSPPEPCS